MAADVETVRKALRATMLADLPIAAAPGDCLMIRGIDPVEVLPAWRTARAVMPTTGRRPLLVSGGSAPRSPGDLGDLDRRARELDPWPVLARPWWDLPLTGDTLRHQIPGFTGADLVAEVQRHVTTPTPRTVHRYVYQRVRDDPALLGQVPPWSDRLTGPGRWDVPDDVSLLLPPTTEAHLLAAWTGAGEVLAAVLSRWWERWRAELVAGWGPALPFVVGHRPESADDVFELAYQIALLSAPEMDLWEIAVAVSRGDEWWLRFCRTPSA